MPKKIRLAIVLIMGLLIAFLNGCADKNSERRPPKERWKLVTKEARVDAIDLLSRKVTLRGSIGYRLTLSVPGHIQRLDKVRVGDIVIAEFWSYFKAEFRDPTEEEVKTPLTVLIEKGKVIDGMPPGAILGSVVKAVVSIEVINIPESMVTIKGPRGNYHTLDVEDQTFLEKMKVGEVVVMTYAEAVALSLKKVAD